MVIGIIALLTGKTGDIIIIACFGALCLYIISMIAVLVLRKKEPDLARPFKTPFYPYTPVIALIVASIALIAMITLYVPLALIYFGIIGVTFLSFRAQRGISQLRRRDPI
jgi:ethanolamine permease